VRSTAVNFMMGNGRSGIETEISRTMLGAFHPIFDAFHISPGNGDYAQGFDTDAFKVQDYTSWDRLEDFGADPLDVVLIWIVCVAFAIPVLRGRRQARLLLLLMAAGLTVGYILFTGTYRWDVVGVRFQIPLFVAWSPLIAIGIARWSQWLLRITMAGLVIACLPQLLNNAERPIIHQSYGSNPLIPYFLDSTYPSSIINAANNYESMSSVVAQSTCNTLGLGNWVLFEYPIWAGLRDDGWKGQIQDIDVTNVTARFENPNFHPCAVLSQQATTYVATDPDEVQVQFGPLALSMAPDFARTVHFPIPGISSDMAGIRVLPGSGWSFNGRPDLNRAGSIFVYSTKATSIDLRFDGSLGLVAAGVAVSSPRGVFPSVTSGSNGLVRIAVRAGVNQVDVAPPKKVAGAPEVRGVEVVVPTA
jgi:hypothetical protein